jgi:hypothetical protein
VGSVEEEALSRESDVDVGEESNRLVMLTCAQRDASSCTPSAVVSCNRDLTNIQGAFAQQASHCVCVCVRVRVRVRLCA